MEERVRESWRLVDDTDLLVSTAELRGAVRPAAEMIMNGPSGTLRCRSRWSRH